MASTVEMALPFDNKHSYLPRFQWMYVYVHLLQIWIKETKGALEIVFR